MSALAVLVKHLGVVVTGCDVDPSGAADLAALGVPVWRGHDPAHVHAFPDGPQAGMVQMPNVDQLEEVVNGMMAARAYEANLTVMGMTRAMASAALRLLA